MALVPASRRGPGREVHADGFESSTGLVDRIARKVLRTCDHERLKTPLQLVTIPQHVEPLRRLRLAYQIEHGSGVLPSSVRWNRTATRRTLDARTPQVVVGTLATAVLGHHGTDLATIAPESTEPVFEHYAFAGKARAGHPRLAGIARRRRGPARAPAWDRSVRRRQRWGYQVGHSGSAQPRPS